ncbi:MAG: Spore protein SP21 [Phycisphaerae bacterium]|nr:Spore protein SP21 [Phycisphaerae bacterium]
MLTRYDWQWPFSQLRREMDRLFDDFNGNSSEPSRGVLPAINLWDEGERLVVEAELPGVKKEDLEILAAGNELTIRGKRNHSLSEKTAYHRQERLMGEFARVITLPVEINADQIEATLTDGVLTLRLTKAEQKKPRKITVGVKE